MNIQILWYCFFFQNWEFFSVKYQMSEVFSDFFLFFLQFLVEELLRRLVVLERNHHPFYSVHAFMDKNAYSEWVIVEKEKIEGLIRSFWHYARPSVRELPLESPEYHKQYVELMKRLIR